MEPNALAAALTGAVSEDAPVEDLAKIVEVPEEPEATEPAAEAEAEAPAQPEGPPELEELDWYGQKYRVPKGDGERLKGQLNGYFTQKNQAIAQEVAQERQRLAAESQKWQREAQLVEQARRDADSLRAQVQEVLEKNPDLHERFKSVNSTSIEMRQMRAEFDRKLAELSQGREEDSRQREFEQCVSDIESKSVLPANELFTKEELRIQAVSLAQAYAQSGAEFDAALLNDCFGKVYRSANEKIQKIAKSSVGYVKGKVAAAAAPTSTRASAPKPVSGKEYKGKSALNDFMGDILKKYGP